ncbi:MAG: diguanylate cyclase [Gammaproteobacteria bacterium]|nr:diguanylate cyclase [Gammaproteobacteria bacterium]
MNTEPLNASIESNKTKYFLVFSFAVIILLNILSDSIGFSHINAVQHDVNKIIATQYTQIDLMHKMRSIARERIIKLQALVATDDIFAQDEIISDFHELGGLFLETRQDLKKTVLTEEEFTLLDIQREIARKSVASQYKVIELTQKGLTEQALDYLVNQTVPIQNENMSFMDQFILYQNHQNQVLKSEALNKNRTAYTIVIILSSLSLLLTLIVAVVVIKRTSKVVNLLSKSVQDHEKTANKLAHIHENLELKVEERTNELKQANLILKHIAGHDSLTDLPNRRLFTELLTQEINRARRSMYNLAILYMDLDGFKAINDALGHDMGDGLLLNIANRLKSSLRKDDLIARFGGDEFIICYSNVKDIEDVRLLCQIIIDKIGQPMYLGKHQCNIGISIGVSLYPEHGTDYNTLLRVADSSMYQVKKQGKNNFAIGD